MLKLGYNYYNIDKVSFPIKLKRKIGKWLAKSGAFNALRCRGLKICGFRIGQQVYIGEELIIVFPVSENNCQLEIGDRVAIAPRVTILLASDPNYSRLGNYYKPIRGTVKLEEDCWLGTGVIIHPNLTIGKAAIVGSGSVVTKNIAPFSIVAGVPARVIGTTNTGKKTDPPSSL